MPLCERPIALPFTCRCHLRSSKSSQLLCVRSSGFSPLWKPRIAQNSKPSSASIVVPAFTSSVASPVLRRFSEGRIAKEEAGIWKRPSCRRLPINSSSYPPPHNPPTSSSVPLRSPNLCGANLRPFPCPFIRLPKKSVPFPEFPHCNFTFPQLKCSTHDACSFAHHLPPHAFLPQNPQSRPR